MPHESMNLNQSVHILHTYLCRYVKKKSCVNMILGEGGGGGSVTSNTWAIGDVPLPGCHCLVMEFRVGPRFLESVLSNTHILGGILFLAFKNFGPSKTFLQDLFVISSFNNLLNFLLWWRYVDDVFMIWSHGEEKANEFVNLLNFSHETIKFTHEVLPSKINFLDVTVLLHYNKIATDLHIKSTDAHQYFLSSSCHHNSIKRSILCSLISLRIAVSAPPMTISNNTPMNFWNFSVNAVTKETTSKHKSTKPSMSHVRTLSTTSNSVKM